MTIDYQNGMWIISDVIDHIRIERKYLWHTKRQAVKLFNLETKIKSLEDKTGIGFYNG